MNKKDGKYIPDDIKGLIDDIQRIKEDVYSRKISHSYDFEKRTDTESLRSRADGDIERSTKWLRKYLTSEETLAPLERTGQHKKKRMDSVIKYAPIANGMLAERYPLLCIPDELSKLNAIPVGIDFATCESKHHIQLAAALWILDELKSSGKLEEAYQFFSQERMSAKDVGIPDVYDPCYSENIVCNMFSIVKDRDKLKANDGLSGREKFKGIVELINHERITYVRNKFEQCQWEYFQLVLETIVYFKEQENELVEELSDRIEEIEKCCEEILSLYDEMSVQLDRLQDCIISEREYGSSNYNFEMVQSLSINKKIGQATDAAMYMLGELSDRYNRLLVLDNRCDCTRALGTSLSPLFETIPMNKCLKDTEKKIREMTVEDPFEICFIYLYMKFTGDDAVWLYNQAIAVLYSAVPLLPWYEARNSRRDWITVNVDATEMICGEDDFELIDDGDDSPVIYAPDPALLYRKDYTDACLWADPEIVPKNELSKRNLSQLIYEMTGVLLPRKGSLWTDYSKLLHLSRIKKQQCIPYEMLIRYLKSQRERSLMPTEEKSTAATKASDAEQIRKFKEDIKRLNTQLRETHDKKNAERKRANQAESQNERYKVEIAELRSMLFDRTAFAREEKKTRLDFPYTAKHKITIFGGHEVWLYSIKPLLSGVRFVGPDERPNVSMIINSEVIWLQTNVMAHSYYNKIVDTARMHNIPVKYFSFSGAEKCAEQLALDDMEVSK